MKARKIIIPVSIIAGIAVIGLAVSTVNGAASATYLSTTEIQMKSLENKISVGGTIKSAESKKVYSQLTYPVEKINVSIGDTVKKGDILCTINTEELQQQILQQQASVESSGISSEYNLSEAEERYAEALAQYENGENASLINAQKVIDQAKKNLEDAKRQEEVGVNFSLPSSVESAEANVTSAKANYDNAVKAYEKAVQELEPEHYPTNIKTVYDLLEEYKKNYELVRLNFMIPELEEAKREYDNALAEYKRAKNDYDMSAGAGSGDKTLDQEAFQNAQNKFNEIKQKYEAVKKKYDLENLKEQIKEAEKQLKALLEPLESAKDSAKTAMENAKLAYDRAVSELESLKKQNGNTQEGYGIAVKNAEEALETAKKDYENTVKQVESELASLKKQAEQQRTISGLNDPQVIILQNYKNKLEYAVIKAPCDGVITEVNAEEGAVPTGALFVIEDLDNLVVSAAAGEYDISYIEEGMPATIRCDAVGGANYDGKITNVNPTSENTLQGSSNTGVSYRIEADIDGEDGKLRVGMSAKVDIVSESRDNALAVTYDALTTDENGNDAVFLAEKCEDGVYHARLVTVKVGLETNYEVEIISSELNAGMKVITDTQNVADGMTVQIDESALSEQTE